MVDISALTSLRTPTQAESVIEINSPNQISDLFSRGFFQKPFYLLGLGANVLFTKDFPGPVCVIKLKGRNAVAKNSQELLVELAAGENWHESVMWAVGNNWSGMENMALIPGTVGAAAVGNIAAYGQNQQDIIDSLTAVNLTTGQTETFAASDCHFAYRESIFKNEFAGKYLVTSVTYHLFRTARPELSYHAARHASLLSELKRLREVSEVNRPLRNRAGAAGTGSSRTDLPDTDQYSVQEVAAAVISLRTSKLPDWTKINTAGSFFKNPRVPRQVAENIKTRIPDLQIYPAEKLSYIPPGREADFVKIPAGMLLDQLGWKGKKIGHVGTYPHHALVIVADPGTSGQEIYEFAEKMRTDVQTQLAVNLEYEVVVV